MRVASKPVRTAVWLTAMTVAGLVVGSCGDDGTKITGPQPPADNSPVLVTEPVLLDGLAQPGPVASGASRGAASVSSSAGSDQVSYVSYPPGSVPEADSIEIRNLTRDLLVAAPMVDGGVDPIAIPASVGDHLEITLYRQTLVLERIGAIVPDFKPPVVTRTNPPRGRTRVPLNAFLAIVFSEPISGQTVTPETIQLLKGGQPVSVTLEQSADGISVELRPDQPLVPGTTYTISVTTGLRDRAGESLEAEVSSEFTTLEAALDSGGTIAYLEGWPGNWRVMLMDGSGGNIREVSGFPFSNISNPMPEGTNDPYYEGPQLSPDGTRITMVYTGEMPFMHMDGTDGWTLRLGNGFVHAPVWSPDGSMFAVNDGRSILIAHLGPLNETGPPDFSSVVASVGAVGRPDWSPDASRLAYEKKDGRIELANVDGFGFQVWISPPGGARHPRWSPDGSRVVFEMRSGEIGAANADGSGFEILIDLPGYATHPQWSPDGSRIAFLRQLPSCALPCVIAIADSAGEGTFEVHDFKDTANFRLIFPFAWSPDGSKVAFTVRWHSFDMIYMINSDGTNLAPVTDGHTQRFLGSWVRGTPR